MAQERLRRWVGALNARPVWGGLIAILLVAAAAGMHALVEVLAPDVDGVAVYFPAVLIATLLAGAAAGTLALVLGSVMYFALLPADATIESLIAAALFCASNALIVIVTAAYVRHEAQSRITAEQLKLAENTARFGLWELDPETLEVAASRNTQRLYGLSGDGRKRRISDYTKRVHPEDADRFQRAAIEKACHGEHFQMEHRLLDAKRGERHILARGSRIMVRGKPKLIGAIFDVTEQKADENLLRSAIASLPWPVSLVAQDGDILATSREWHEVAGQTGLKCLSLWTGAVCPEHHSTVAGLMTRALMDNIRTSEEIALKRPDGARRIWRIKVTPIGVLADGRRYATIAFRDVTEERSREEQRTLVIREFKHRLSNMAAVLTAIVGQSLRSKPEERRALIGRIETYMRTHQLLSAVPDEAVPLVELLAQELGALQVGERVKVAGPAIALEPNTAIALAMSLHELVTNALKYGALKDEEGEITIQWRVTGRELVFHWTETAARPIRPPQKEGFGTKLLSRAFEGLGGHVERTFAPTGFRCSILIPARSLRLQRTAA